MTKTLTIELPIYYKQEFKTKKSKELLVGLNNYRNWYHVLSNNVKRYYHELVAQKIGTNTFKKVTIHYDVYVRRNGTDGPNIRSVIEKFFLDGMVVCGAIPDDNISYVIGDSSSYYIDPRNPRIEITITEVE